MNNFSVNKGTKGSFEELVEDCRRRARDEEEVDRLLTERIAHMYVARLIADRNERLMVNDNRVTQVRTESINSVTQQAVKIPGADVDHHDKKSKNKLEKKRVEAKMPQQESTSRFKLPDKLKKYIEENGGTDIKLVIKKKIFKSDLERHNNRLTIPKNQVIDNTFITEEEREFIDVDDKKDKKRKMVEHDDHELPGAGMINFKKKKKNERPGINVMLVDPYMEEYEQILKTWDMNTTAYVMSSNWNAVVKRHEHVLKEGTTVQVWSFRRRRQQQQRELSLSLERQRRKLDGPNLRPSDLCFALIIVDGGEGSSSCDGASSSGSGDIINKASA